MLLTDYHSHTALSPDGKVSLAEMAAAARAAGLAELCVTDHCDLLDENGRPAPSWASFFLRLPPAPPPW